MKAKIGLEVHIQLKTKTKIFCGCKVTFGEESNKHVCPICLGYPGVLPVLNDKVIYLAILAGLALNCEIAEETKFDRKNYFYPDSPKNYQITQYDKPICSSGFLEIILRDKVKKIEIKRIHIEEESGKLIHQFEDIMKAEYSLVDYNRSGIPLLEIVTEPDISNSEEAKEFLLTLKTILEYLNISDCNLEQGGMRVDVNVSVGDGNISVNKVEIKNLNSLKSIGDAIDFEIERQSNIFKLGGKVVSETRLWHPSQKMTISMRSKERSSDYRYFTEPDIPPLFIDKKIIDDLRDEIGTLPNARKKEYIEKYNLSYDDASVIAFNIKLAKFFEEACKLYDETYNDKNYKKITNWLVQDVMKVLKEKDISIDESKLKPKDVIKIIEVIEEEEITGKIAKGLIEEIVMEGKDINSLIKGKGIEQMKDRHRIGDIIDKVLNAYPDEVKKYKAGKRTLIGFFVGEVMNETKGKSNPKIVNILLEEKLENKNT
jgi:aspartyl-tRNA(Asn)/glutamyl-tRNA(Gln) amidotransferase subunit B